MTSSPMPSLLSGRTGKALLVLAVLAFAVVGYYLVELREPWLVLDVGTWKTETGGGKSSQGQQGRYKSRFAPSGTVLVMADGPQTQTRRLTRAVAEKLRVELKGTGFVVELAGENTGAAAAWPRPDGLAPVALLQVRYDAASSTVARTGTWTTEVTSRAEYGLLLGRAQRRRLFPCRTDTGEWAFTMHGWPNSKMTHEGFVTPLSIKLAEVRELSTRISQTVAEELKKRCPPEVAAMQPTLRQLVPAYQPPVDTDVLDRYSPTLISTGAAVLCPNVTRWQFRDVRPIRTVMDEVAEALRLRGWTIDQDDYSGVEKLYATNGARRMCIEEVLFYNASASPSQDPKGNPDGTQFDVMYVGDMPRSDAKQKILALGPAAPVLLQLQYNLAFKDMDELRARCSPAVVALVESIIPLALAGRDGDARKIHADAIALAERESAAQGKPNEPLPAMLRSYPFLR